MSDEREAEAWLALAEPPPDPDDENGEDEEEADAPDEESKAAPLPADRLLYPHVPRLSVEAEADLARRIAGGDGAAEAQLVEAHIYLAIGVARRRLGRGVALADLVQEGTLGLVIAARRWQPTGEARFATYAEHWVKARVRLALTRASLVLPAHAVERRRQIAEARARLRAELGRDPTEHELAEAAGLSPRQLRASRRAIAVIGLDDTLGESGDDRTVADQLPDPSVPAALDAAESFDRLHLLVSAMDRACLTERERAVLWLRYGLDDEEPRNFRDIGAALGIRHASQLVAHEASALRKLRGVLDESPDQSSAASGPSYGPGSTGVAPGITRRPRGGTVGSIRSPIRASTSAASSSSSSRSASSTSAGAAPGRARACRT